MKIHILERKVKKQAQINEPVFLSPYDKPVSYTHLTLPTIA